MRPIWLLFMLLVVTGAFLFVTVLDGGGSTDQVSPTAWYCSDDGHEPPRHLVQPRLGLHACTDGELHDAGYWSGVL
jgi:hypothetical protein